MTFISNQRIAVEGEDCQNLNVWTPGINDGKKRPVMVWLHGGGFQTGSAIEQRVYDGTNLSRKGDVVVVSINHRLNVLGFLDLSAYGNEYRYSGNAGTMDMVAALKWIQSNIEVFGGDPDNITLFGQSGGGAKNYRLDDNAGCQRIVSQGNYPKRCSRSLRNDQCYNENWKTCCRIDLE